MSATCDNTFHGEFHLLSVLAPLNNLIRSGLLISTDANSKENQKIENLIENGFRLDG